MWYLRKMRRNVMEKDGKESQREETPETERGRKEGREGESEE